MIAETASNRSEFRIAVGLPSFHTPLCNAQTLTSIPKTDNQPTPFNLSTPQGLLSTLQELRQTVEAEGKATFEQWRSHIERPEFLASALNLAEYLALRRHDLRSLQIALKPWGLSSLGRIEARVIANLDAVITTLEVICGSESHHNRPPIEFFLEGDRLLQQHTEELLGDSQRRVRIMVTLDTDAATDYERVRGFVRSGANCMRINCAHDSPEIWEDMIKNIRQAEDLIGNRVLRIYSPFLARL